MLLFWAASATIKLFAGFVYLVYRGLAGAGVEVVHLVRDAVRQ